MLMTVSALEKPGAACLQRLFGARAVHVCQAHVGLDAQAYTVQPSGFCQ